MANFIDAFEVSVQKFPSNTAIIYLDSNKIYQNVAYNTLQAIINKITTKLRQNIQKHACISVLLEFNLTLPAVILSIQKNQSAFFCIDSNISASQLLDLITRVKFEWIITSDLKTVNKEFKTCLDKNGSIITSIIITENNIQCTLHLWRIKTDLNDIKIYKNVSYVIQTSGTTGKNKVVQVLHKCIMSNIEGLKTIFEITNKDVIFLSTPVTFDPFIVELMLALTTGATLFITENRFNFEFIYEILLPENDSLNPGITFWQMPPSVFQSLPKNMIDYILTGRSSVRILALGGEKFPDYIYDYPNRSRILRIFNLYGITEVSCWASLDELKDTPEISLGKTLNDTLFQIRNNEDVVLEKGEGHLFIGSEVRHCLIDGENMSELHNKTVFRETGDLVQYDEKQNKYYYLGRKNDIFKRLGHKINLNTMEKLVYNATELLSVCIWDQNISKLFLFVVLSVEDDENKTKIIDKLRIKLLHCLPSEYHPDYVQIISQIPLTNNGKIDKKGILNDCVINATKIELTPQEWFEKIWCKHFGNDLENRKNVSFMSLGGNSILAIQIVAELESEVKDCDGGRLTELLLDKNKCYDDYFNCLTKITNTTERIIIKTTNLDTPLQHDVLQNVTNKITLKINWKHDLKACVDCAAVAFTHKSLGNILLIGSHSHLFTIFNSESGVIIAQTILPDAIEGTVCISECQKWAIIGCNDGNIYCICIKSGAIVWTFSTGSSVKSTPILTPDNKKIIFGSYDKNLYCLNIKDGILFWKCDINQSIKSNVIIKDNVCYVASLQGSYYCISIDTGTIKWNIDTKISVFGSPCIIEKDNVIMWANVRGAINCFDCAEGQKLWMFETKGTIFSSLCQFDDSFISFSCFDQNIVYVCQCTRNSCQIMQIINVGGEISSTPFLFTLNNNLHCLTVTNKGLLQVIAVETKEIQQRIQLPNEVFSSPILARDRIFVGCRDNHIYCIKMYLNS